MDEKHGSVRYGDSIIQFDIEPRKSEIRKVLIKVHPDSRVVAKVPTATTHLEVINAVKKRSRWIYRQLQYFEGFRDNILPRHYVSGECHFYLGRRHLLKVYEDINQVPEVKLLRGVLEVKIQNADSRKIKTLLFNWYKCRAREVFEKRLNGVMSKAPWVTIKPEIKLVSMQTQWGSCSSSGKLTLNPHLIKAPTECIDYVLLHELCHIAEHNHSERFYRVLKKVMPNWENVKERLDGMAYFYLNDV